MYRYIVYVPLKYRQIRVRDKELHDMPDKIYLQRILTKKVTKL